MATTRDASRRDPTPAAVSTTTTTTTTLHHLVDKRFVGITPDGMRIVIDGEAEHKAGMSPMQLVLNALAACVAYDVVEMIAKRRLELVDYRIEMAGEREGSPRAYTRIHTRHVFDAPGLERTMAERFVQLAHTKYCSVGASLRAEQTFDVVLEHEAADAGAEGAPLSAADG